MINPDMHADWPMLPLSCTTHAVMVDLLQMISQPRCFFFFNLKNLISLVDLISIQDGRNREYPISCVVKRQAFHRE